MRIHIILSNNCNPQAMITVSERSPLIKRLIQVVDDRHLVDLQ